MVMSGVDDNRAGAGEETWGKRTCAWAEEGEAGEGRAEANWRFLPKSHGHIHARGLQE